MGTGGQAWVSKTCNVFDTFPYSVPTIGLIMVGVGEKNLKLRLSDDWKARS